MKIRFYTLLLLSFAALGCDDFPYAPPTHPTWPPSTEPEGEAAPFDCVAVDPLQKIFLEDESFESFDRVLPYAKGETAAFQFVVNCPEPMKELKIEAGALVCGSNSIEASMTAFENYIVSGLHFEPASNVAMFPVSDKYPDCLKEVPSVNVSANVNQPVWVNYRIDPNAPAGRYEGKIRLSASVGGEQFVKEMPVALDVKNVTLAEQELFISNWHNHTYFSLMNNGSAVPVFSDRYFQLLTEMVHVMRDHGQNVYWLNPLLDFVKCTKTGGHWSFDFTNMNKVIEVFVKEGGAKRIEGGHLAARKGGWDDPFGVLLPGSGVLADISTDDAALYISEFITALEANLREHGWWEMYMQHVADEPSDGNRQSYVDIVRKIKTVSSSIKIIDAIHSSQFDDVVDVWVPLLNLYGSGYSAYQRRQSNGDEVWFYTCLDPKGNYANRLLEQPLVQMRILHWINFKYGATGYLHWGFNQAWSYATQGIATETYCPGGDMFIVYPAYEKVYSSIRLEAMRDGIDDYTLLCMLQKKNPAKAKEIVESVVYGFASYNNSNDNFHDVREKLLGELEK